VSEQDLIRKFRDCNCEHVTRGAPVHINNRRFLIVSKSLSTTKNSDAELRLARRPSSSRYILETLLYVYSASFLSTRALLRVSWLLLVVVVLSSFIKGEVSGVVKIGNSQWDSQLLQALLVL
jgi:hypothetical protein